MFTKQDLLDTLDEEIRLIRHLATKVDPGQQAWQACPELRTTIELMRYMTYCGIGPVRALAAGDWDMIGPLRDRVEDMDLAGFDAAMERQREELHEALGSLSDAQLEKQEAMFPWGGTAPLGRAIFQTSVRFFAAYRMQLFVHAKASSDPTLNTWNAWMGKDQPQEAPA